MREKFSSKDILSVVKTEEIIASINREQLIHSISKYYGTNFDAIGYLDKFFDWNIYLPELDTRFDNGLDFTYEQYL